MKHDCRPADAQGVTEAWVLAGSCGDQVQATSGGIIVGNDNFKGFESRHSLEKKARLLKDILRRGHR